jgi:hypothetical protein
MRESPCFGGEAASTFLFRLEALGLSYIDDFYSFAEDLPEWISFRAEYQCEREASVASTSRIESGCD